MHKKLLILFILLPVIAFSQGPSVNVKKEKLYIDDNPICIIDKKKKGLLGNPSFEIKTLDEKPLGVMQYMSVTLPISGVVSWYKLTLEGVSDSVQFSIPGDFKNFNKSTFMQYDEALGKIIATYELVKNNSANGEGLGKLKKEYAADYARTYSEQAEKEKYCQGQLTAPAKSDAAKTVTVVHTGTIEATKYTTVITYDITQDGQKIGSIVAKGSPKGAKQEDAEYDYSPGLLDLDGASPLDYEILTADGCVIARYLGTEKKMGTWKDRVEIKTGDLKKYNKNGVKSRLDYMTAIANYLVTKRYL
jgi:hypothetical protein